METSNTDSRRHSMEEMKIISETGKTLLLAQEPSTFQIPTYSITMWISFGIRRLFGK
jgi:hypothetical protein